MKVYAFDVDDTLNISKGPIPLDALMQLRVDGHVVGLCGNWAAVTANVPGWQHLVSFMNVGLPKEEFLRELKKHVPAEDYVMVGNIPGVSGPSNDITAAYLAGWRFIRELDFANGVR